jgi:hypothetical protein
MRPVGEGGEHTDGMIQATKERARRERLREYEAALSAARAPIGVLVQFVQAREARAHGEALEELFAATPVAGVDDEHRLPAALWVALRQGDVDATIDVLARVSRTELVIAAHEELDAGYRLTTVEERRTLPDVEALEAHIAAFLQVPPDVVAMIAGWGADDPRTAAEIGTLVEQRFGPAAPGGSDALMRVESTPSDIATSEGSIDQPATAGETSPVPAVTGPRASLVMFSAEFVALLKLTPEQREVLGVLVRQADITILAGH